MKPSPFFCRALMLIFLLSCLDLFARSGSLSTPDSIPHYVVIGAFAKQRNAVKFVNHASKKLNISAKYEMNPSRNLYYVYCLTTTDRSVASSEAMRLRSETELSDAWVYHGDIGAKEETTSLRDVNPETNQKIQTIVAKDQPKEVPSKPEESMPVTTPDVVEVIEATVAEVPALAQEPFPLASDYDEDAPGKNFVFEVVRFTDKVPVKAKVDVVDPDKARVVKGYEANMQVKVTELKNKSGMVTLVAQATGYRKAQRDIKFNADPGDSAIRIDEKGRTIVPFELVRLKKGDFAILYNVFYFRDAAIMRPESKFEVNALVEMMKENPKCAIRLHGHTNGNHAGKIIYWGDGTDDLFSLNGSRESWGSAKELSGARASAIQAYLISQGIDASRCEVKAWGGKKSIHDKLSARAQENVRVEIEIVKD